MATGIMNNEVKQQQAAELAARVAMFLATGGAIKTTKTGRRGRTTVSQVHTPRVVVVEKQRYTWDEAKQELAELGLLNKQVQSAIKARQ
jgi:translation initiation factor 1 (eIF-1/SUI1)